MYVERIRKPGDATTSYRTMLGNVVLDFALMVDVRGRHLLAAEVAPGDEAEVRMCVGAAVGYRLVKDEQIGRKPVRLSDGVAAFRAEPGPSASPADLAIANGWQPEDLHGTNQGGDPGPKGGTSPATGLNLGQMAMCTPPAGWLTARAESYPWQVPGWVPPPRFQQPAVALKVAPAAPSALEAAPVEVLEGARELIAPVIEAAEAVEPYPQAEWDAALAVIKSIFPSAKRPSVARVRARLQHAGLPTLSDDEAEARQQLEPFLLHIEASRGA
jgi:hypothetical protein